ncbi:hypothetical protein HK098_004337 [Nowakowskiella sp. JEL0407]|nr:hypothetical protein HK098_004337 [Nowakowskiella sp. JEL0407]
MDENKKQVLEEVEKRLLQISDTLYRLSITLLDFQPESSNVVLSRVDDYVRQLADLSAANEKVDVQFPAGLLEAIDEGKNPDLYMQHLIETLNDKNQKTNGRIESIKGLRDELRKEIEMNFKNDVAVYEKAKEANNQVTIIDD